MTTVLKGSPVSAEIDKRTKARVNALAKNNVFPTLAIVRVGNRQEDVAYENSILRRAGGADVLVKLYHFDETITEHSLLGAIDALNNDAGIHGILLMRPLPDKFDAEKTRNAISVEKDVDGITDGSLAGVFTGAPHGFPPCTAEGCIHMLDHYGIDCTGKCAVVVGRSLVVGKPVGMLLLGRNATVTICHTKTVALPAIARNAEILIVATGCKYLVTKDYVSPGQTVIDVGIHAEPDGGMCGDVRYDEIAPLVGAATPVPGGVGGVTTSVLLSHVAEAAERQA